MSNRITEKKVIIKSFGVIDILNGALGPILNPMNLDINTIMHLVNTGKEVYEISEDGKSEVKLTLRNYQKNNFSKVVKNETPVSEKVAAINKTPSEELNEVVVEDAQPAADVKYYNNNQKNKKNK